MSNTNEITQKFSSSTYIKVFFILTILTGLTILQPLMIHMNYAPTLKIQMLIAFTKITLVVMYYMHIKGASSIYKRMIFAAMLLVTVLAAFTMGDTYIRLLMHNDFFSN